jgi:hypothetical protein
MAQVALVFVLLRNYMPAPMFDLRSPTTKDVLGGGFALQRPPYQGGHNGRDLGHVTFCGILSAVRLGMRLPSIFRRRRSFFLGFAGWA